MWSLLMRFLLALPSPVLPLVSSLAPFLLFLLPAALLLVALPPVTRPAALPATPSPLRPLLPAPPLMWFPLLLPTSALPVLSP
ncbi:hypothetical protein BDV26DRAFT_252590 [Aspergillus bertholletiae]|uniref:Uncharacterized protein n=1 Tax=Aspergillus bertholletiae TaxID=1226010 RepID=A0A5N7BLV7_9EURO|nr:hypothetical protein BDV26DRAFT_252590 [Aspergillus bertholletiae]